MKQEYKENYIKSKNQLNKIVNELAPKIDKYFADNDIKYKVDHRPHKKHDDAIRAIIEPYNNQPNVRIWMHYSEYSKYINFDATYKNGEFGCAYIKEYHYMGSEFTPRKNITLKQYDNARKRIVDIENTMQKLRSEKSRLKLTINQ